MFRTKCAPPHYLASAAHRPVRQLALTTPRFRTPRKSTADGAVLQVTPNADAMPNPYARNKLRPRFCYSFSPESPIGFWNDMHSEAKQPDQQLGSSIIRTVGRDGPQRFSKEAPLGTLIVGL